MPHPHPNGHSVSRLLDGVYLFCIWVSGICVALMSAFIPWGIFTRYVLGTGSQWPEPVSIQLMVIFTFLGAAASYRAGGHIAVQMLTQRLPESARHTLSRVVHVLMLLICLFMVWFGAQLCIGTWRQSIPELPLVPVGLAYLPVPLGAAITALFVIEHLLLGNQSDRAVVTFDQETAKGEGAR